jgi:AcrR family transcriptional regulator
MPSEPHVAVTARARLDARERRRQTRSLRLTAGDFQRDRIVAAATIVACEHGVGGTTVSRVIGRAGISRRTFYELFDDCGDCLCAAFEQILASAGEHVSSAYRAESRWIDRVRAGLTATLEYFDEQPALARLCFVQATAAGKQTLAARAELIDLLARELDDGYNAERPTRKLASSIAHGVIGGLVEVVHAQLVRAPEQRLILRRNELMAIVALPYLGPAASHRELTRPLPATAEMAPRRQRSELPVRAGVRMTYRTRRVLSVVADRPGLSNREISDLAGIADQGQISKLLTRLGELGLLENVGDGQALGRANAWRLAARGSELMHAVGYRGAKLENGRHIRR